MKAALAVLLFFLLSGCIIVGVTTENIIQIAETLQPGFGIVIGILVLGLFVLLIYIVGKSEWLGEMNQWLDKYLFGFLGKSNDVIFHSLLYALRPEERTEGSKINSVKQNDLVQSIFSVMSSDVKFFEILLQSKIFSKWTWYWTFVYGTLIFTALTIISFTSVAIGGDKYSLTVFTICWLIT